MVTVDDFFFFNKRINYLDLQLDGWMDGLVGWIHGWAGGWMEDKMDGCVEGGQFHSSAQSG